MKKPFLFLLTLFFAQLLSAQSNVAGTDTINQRIFLIGDAGELHFSSHPVIDWLKKNVNWDDEKNTVLFLGDNIYPSGMAW